MEYGITATSCDISVTAPRFPFSRRMLCVIGHRVKRYVPLLLLCAACAPQEQPVAPREATALIEPRHFIATDGASLPLKSWIPHEKPSAVIIALHGMNDYHHGMGLMALAFKEAGMATYAIDQRGFGQAPGRGIWPGEANMVADTQDMLRALRAQYPDTPLFLLGESMGAAVAMLSLQGEGAHLVNGAIFVSPAVWDEGVMGPLYRSVLWALAHIMPSTTLTGEGLKIVATDNATVLREMSRDENIIRETRIDAIYGVVEIMNRAGEQKLDANLPLLIIYGEKDEVIPPNAMGALGKRLTGKNQSTRVYADHYHLLLRDIERDAIHRDVIEWIRQQSPHR